ncbi:MAG: DUF992 domain-containing protein [Bauldia sp.]|nr:DUF992 domain-containing protein [Bauldia sp.]
MKSKFGRALAGVAALMMIFSFYASKPAEAAHIKIGVLTCAAGVQVGLLITSGERIQCSFVPDATDSENYHGYIRKFGLDVGITAASVIVWAVMAVEGTKYTPGALAGTYAGLTAEETLALGLGANVLVGGSQKSFALQPLSVSGQAGLNLAVGVSILRLESR